MLLNRWFPDFHSSNWNFFSFFFFGSLRKSCHLDTYWWKVHLSKQKGSQTKHSANLLDFPPLKKVGSLGKLCTLLGSLCFLSALSCLLIRHVWGAINWTLCVPNSLWHYRSHRTPRGGNVRILHYKNNHVGWMISLFFTIWVRIVRNIQTCRLHTGQKKKGLEIVFGIIPFENFYSSEFLDVWLG